MTDQPVEWMDREDWPEETMEGALAALDRSHRLLGTYRRVVRRFQTVLSARAKPVILDIGGADGRFGRYLNEHWKPVRYISMDPKFSHFPGTNAPVAGLAQAAPPIPLESNSVDAVVSLLTLHHLPDDVLPELLLESTRVARRLVLHEDLLPGRLHGGLAWTFSRLISRNQIFRHDALISVQRSRSLDQWNRLINQHELPYQVETRFPFRCQLVHEPLAHERHEESFRRTDLMPGIAGAYSGEGG